MLIPKVEDIVTKPTVGSVTVAGASGTSLSGPGAHLRLAQRLEIPRHAGRGFSHAAPFAFVCAVVCGGANQVAHVFLGLSNSQLCPASTGLPIRKKASDGLPAVCVLSVASPL